MNKLMLVFAAVAAIAGCAPTVAMSPELRPTGAPEASLTREHFRNTAEVKGDSLDTTVTVNTFQGFKDGAGPFGLTTTDAFLRAFVTKKTGSKRFQLYQTIYYDGSGWHFYELANYETEGEPKAVKATVISRDVGSCSGRGRGCSHWETVAFDVDESLLRAVARRPAGDNWDFKFKAKSGNELHGHITPAEAGGLLDRVDELSGKAPAKPSASNAAGVMGQAAAEAAAEAAR